MPVNLTNVNAAGISLTSSKAGKVIDPSEQSSMDKDAFLKLLAAQAKTQDPMNPTDSTAQIAQLAQFSSLEQMLNVATQMSNLATTTNNQAAVQLVGHDVTYLDPATGQQASGTVSAVTMTDDGPLLTVGGQTGISPNEISEVR